MGTRPFDDDEDPTPRANAPKRPAGGPSKPGVAGKPATIPPPNEPAGPQRLAWGLAGNVNFAGELSDQTGREGVIRLVGTGISYKAPPLDRYVWQTSLEQPGRYEMAWSGDQGDPAQVQTLADLGAELRRGPTPAKQRLQQLDRVAQTLLQTTQVLHDNNRRLGLLHPGNVLLVPNSETGEVVLPDLGFIWTGKHGEPPWEDNPARPAWLEKDPSRNRNAAFWDEEPARQQFTSPIDDLPVVSVESDLKTLARIFASVLTGKAERNPVAPPNAAECWNVLKAVLKGEIKTAEEFSSRLAEKPLSLTWAKPAPPPKKSKAPLVVLLLGLLLCVGPLGLLGYLYQAGRPPFAKATTPSTGPLASNTATSSSKTPTSGAPTSGKSSSTSTVRKVEVDWKNKPAGKPTLSELDSLMSQFDATKDPKRRVEILTQMYALYGRSDEKEQKGMAPFIEWARGVYVNDWTKRYHTADDSLLKQATRLDGAKAINDLNVELTGLRQKSEPISPSLNERETQCLEVSGLRATELGSRR